MGESDLLKVIDKTVAQARHAAFQLIEIDAILGERMDTSLREVTRIAELRRKGD